MMRQKHSDALGLPGGPAFPVSIPGVGDNGCGGMSLRDWFAGQALSQAISFSQRRWDPVMVARRCYAIADAMLDDRALPQSQP